MTLKNAGVPEDKIEPQLIEKLKEELFIAGVIDGKNMLTKEANKINENVEFADSTLKERAIMIMKKFICDCINEITNTIMYHTSLPRFAIFRIIKGAVNKYYKVDVPSEYDFAENLDDDDNVLLFNVICDTLVNIPTVSPNILLVCYFVFTHNVKNNFIAIIKKLFAFIVPLTLHKYPPHFGGFRACLRTQDSTVFDFSHNKSTFRFLI